MNEPDLNNIEVLAALPGKDIYGVEVGHLVNAIESGAEEISRLRSELAARDEALKAKDAALSVALECFARESWGIKAQGQINTARLATWRDFLGRKA